jgi:hypothetical protein
MVKKKKENPVSHKIDSSFTEHTRQGHPTKKDISKAVSKIKSVGSDGETVRILDFESGDTSYSSVQAEKGGKGEREITYSRKVKGGKTKTTTVSQKGKYATGKKKKKPSKMARSRVKIKRSK